jgi:hypothetical protein
LHDQLDNRGLTDQHLIDAITDLTEDLDGKVDKLTGETECDYLYAKHANGAQGFQLLWTEPEPNPVPSRDDFGVLYAEPGYDEKSVVVKGQLDAEVQEIKDAINDEATAGGNVDTTLQSNIDAEATAREAAICHLSTHNQSIYCKMIAKGHIYLHGLPTKMRFYRWTYVKT